MKEKGGGVFHFAACHKIREAESGMKEIWGIREKKGVIRADRRKGTVCVDSGFE